MTAPGRGPEHGGDRSGRGGTPRRDADQARRDADPGGAPGRDPEVALAGSRRADAPTSEPGGRTTVRYLPPWRVELTVRPGVRRILALDSLARLAAAALEAARAPAPASLGLILSGDAELAALNLQAMGREGPTDVLSFPLLPPAAFPPHAGQGREARGPAAAFALPPGTRPHLGDIVVSVDRAVDQAREGRGGQTGDVAWEPADELALLVVHGALHVCSWDHAEPEEEAGMRSLERRILAGASHARRARPR